MSLSGARPLDPWIWLGLPALQAIGATLLFAIPARVWGLQLPEPVFPLAAVFAWAVIRPSMLAPFAALAMGLFLDVFWGAPLGLWALALLAAYGAALGARSMMLGQSQPILWAWFAAVCGLALASAYVITMIDVAVRPNMVNVLWQLLATVVLYPFAHRLIDRFEDADVRFR